MKDTDDLMALSSMDQFFRHVDLSGTTLFFPDVLQRARQFLYYFSGIYRYQKPGNTVTQKQVLQQTTTYVSGGRFGSRI
jgi:hypothetical protein